LEAACWRQRLQPEMFHRRKGSMVILGILLPLGSHKLGGLEGFFLKVDC
jgi:hypothetical protein